ncbi:predicted dehydrogenase [Terrimicrobium sacchariphilum]|uniref:Predicted dehydrogenase n=1 Tax=Terrimicrobium sacchariphilum TaxID=690879 RepID=A0A146G384_TERSA|nr:predicted dehydrogenase [Terrimicrobium sacchariphilum]
MTNSDGMTYAPQGKPAPVCKPGEFLFAAVALDHGHIYGQTNGLVEAGGEVKWVYDSDPAKVAAFQKSFPTAKAAGSLEEILDDASIKMVAAAAIPNKRGPLGCKVLEAGKDYFTDKTPFTTLAQLDEAREVAARTGQRYMVYYSERLHVESAVFAGQLIASGAIGRVVQTAGFGPHRLSASARPAWFFNKEEYGGILCDIGSHQSEQFLYYTGSSDASVVSSSVGNFANPDYPELEDFGEASLVGNNGASGYYRVDWLTPDGLRSWGDGRTLILGTKGYIEMRKYIDITSQGADKDVLFLVDQQSEQRIECAGKVGYPFFGQLILDCLNRTENAMTQAHAFKAAELCLKAQLLSRRIHG